jgi:hypothetical protein
MTSFLVSVGRGRMMMSSAISERGKGGDSGGTSGCGGGDAGIRIGTLIIM